MAREWKGLLALVSLALSLLLWVSGLQESLQRPSVDHTLTRRQLELAIQAAPLLPPPLAQVLGEEEPLAALRDALEQQLNAAPEPPLPADALELALLELRSGQREAGRSQLETLQGQVPPEQRPLLRLLADGGIAGSAGRAWVRDAWELTPLQAQLVCEQLQSQPAGACLPPERQRQALARWLAVSLAPLVLLGAGLLLGLRRLWQWGRGSAPVPAPLLGPELELVDGVLLIAGGFVVLGELLAPLLLVPLVRQLLAGWRLAPPLDAAVQVPLLYLGLMVAPLLILAALLAPLANPPAGGWLQWRWRPLGSGLRRALAQTLMVLPAVALAGWLIDQVWGDPGGSNPLLELVLRTHSWPALGCLALTAVVLAPLFEETLFRGVLLPVLARRWGRGWGVAISALVFGLAHLSLGELTPLVLLGLALGWLRLESGRLGPCVLMHGLWNGLTFANLVLLAG